MIIQILILHNFSSKNLVLALLHVYKNYLKFQLLNLHKMQDLAECKSACTNVYRNTHERATAEKHSHLRFEICQKACMTVA